jgi:hypothetical protein
MPPLDLPGGARPYVLGVDKVVCSYFDVSPIAPGTTGWAN